MFDDSNPDRSPDERLDDLLEKARWPDALSGAESRLRATLSAEHERRDRPRRIAWGAWLIGGAVAAALAVASALGPWSWTHGHLKEPAREARGDIPIAVPTGPATTPADVRPEPLPTSRPPNMHERLILIAERRAVRPASPPPPIEQWRRPPSQNELRAQLQSARATDRPDLVRESIRSADGRVLANLTREAGCRSWHATFVDELLSRPGPANTRMFLELVADRSTSKIAVGALRTRPGPPVDRLIEALADPSVRIRFAAAKSLGAVCDRPLLDRLLRMVDAGPCRREALAAILSSPAEITASVLPALSAQAAGREQVKVIRAELASF